MSASELGEHAGYLSDGPKLDAYRTALGSLVQGRSVLDLGAGTGILGLIAAQVDARIVYAVDSGPILGAAIEVANQAQLNDKFVHIRGRSTEIELPERVDVAVCDQIGGFVHDAGVLEYFADARRRLLSADGVLVPAAFRMFLAPAECTKIRDQIDVWGSSPAGFDFAAFRELAVNTEYHVDGDQVRLLAPGVEIARISSDHTDPIKGGGTIAVDLEGRCDGLVGWFEADMGAGVTLTNHPDDPGRMHRWCNLYPTTNGAALAREDTVELKVDVRPLLGAVTWNIRIKNASGESTVEERHSTLLGRFLAQDDLVRAAGAPVAATPIGLAVARMLELADGTRSTADVMTQLQSENLVDLDSHSVDQILRNTLEQFTTPLSDGASE